MSFLQGGYTSSSSSGGGNITPVYFSWTPVDANQLVGYASASGLGCIIGRKVLLQFTITFTGQVPSPDYISQVNGWDTNLNFGSNYYCGTGRSLASGNNNSINMITSNNDKCNITFNGIITYISQLINKTVAGQIEYVISQAAYDAFMAKVNNNQIYLI